MNEAIKIRYGETINLKVEAESTAVTATLYVGIPGETPLITVPATFTDGVAYINSTEEDTKIPLGDYKYMVKITYTSGAVKKYPHDLTCEDCDNSDDLPDFFVREALDEEEVVS